MKNYLIKNYGIPLQVEGVNDLSKPQTPNQIEKIQEKAFAHAKSKGVFFKNAAFPKTEVLNFLEAFDLANGLLGIYLVKLRAGSEKSQTAPLLCPHQAPLQNSTSAYLPIKLNQILEVENFSPDTALNVYICSTKDETAGPIYDKLDFRYPNDDYFQPTSKKPTSFSSWQEGFQLGKAIKDYPDPIVSEKAAIMQGYFGAKILKELLETESKAWDHLVIFPTIFDIQDKENNKNLDNNTASAQHYIQYAFGLEHEGKLLPFDGEPSYFPVAGVSWPRPWIKNFNADALSTFITYSIRGFF